MPSSPENRENRLEAIQRIVGTEHPGSQRQLAEQLRGLGFDVTQSSVSRDLRDLGVAKVGGRYTLVSQGLPEGAADELIAVGRTIHSILDAGPHMLVIKTATGGAAQVGLALDTKGWREIVGTIAGDDTVFVAFRTKRDRSTVKARMNALLTREENHG